MTFLDGGIATELPIAASVPEVLRHQRHEFRRRLICGPIPPELVRALRGGRFPPRFLSLSA